MGSRWWADEPEVLSRRQSLPHTDSKPPTTGDVWRIVKHMVQQPMVKDNLFEQATLHKHCHRVMDWH